MTVTKYKPTGPYVFKSGKNKGKSIEQLMFSNYSLVLYMLGQANRKTPTHKNVMHKHLEWILEQAQTRKLTMSCPQCHERSVHYFSVLGEQRHGYSMSSGYTCCKNEICMNNLKSMGIEKTPLLIPISFGAMGRFALKHDKKQVAQLLRKCFELPNRLTKQTLFNFFSK